MAIDKSLTPNVSEVDLDAFVSGGQKRASGPVEGSDESALPDEKRTKRKAAAKPVKKLAKSKDPQYHKLTLYLPKELIGQLKVAVASEPDKDISEVSAELYAAYVAKAMKKMLKQFN